MKIKKFFETLALLLFLFYVEFSLVFFVYISIKDGFSWFYVLFFTIVVILATLFLLMILKPGIFTDYKDILYPWDRSPSVRPITPRAAFASASIFMNEKQSPGCAIFMGWLMLLIPLIIIIYNLIFD